MSVFAANLWHQGLVHDAVACASFLKLHPNLPKQVDPIVLRGDPQNRERIIRFYYYGTDPTPTAVDTVRDAHEPSAWHMAPAVTQLGV